GGRALPARFRFATLGFREDALHEAVAEPLQRLFYAADIHDIVANPEDHAPPAGCPSRAALAPVPRRASLMSARMRATASWSPPKIASPIRKWPMLSSTTSGIRATGATVL